MTSVLKSRIVQALGPRARIARVIVAVAFAGLFTASCSDTSGPATLLTLTVSPISQTLAVNGTHQFTAGGTDATGNVTLKGETWSVVAGGGTISSSGLFTAGTVAGTFTNTVKVTCGGKDAFATVIVTPGPLLTITVTPNPDTLAIGATQTFTAVGRDAFNNVITPFTPSWSVTAGGGTIPTGTTGLTALFTAGTVAGAFPNTVRATQGTIFGTATVVVTPGALATITVTPNPDTLAIGATQTFTAVGRDANNNVVAITPVWSVTAGGGTIPTGTTGLTALFTAGTVTGTFDNTVRATQGTIFGTATVVVIAGPPATIVVTPDPGTLRINTTLQFTAVVRDAGGNVLVVTPTWSVVNGGGSINATGLFTAGDTTGTFLNTVRAATGALADTATVIVTSAVAPAPSLGSASNFGILAGQGITCAISGTVNGATGTADIGSMPLIVYTGFAPPPAVCTFTGIIPGSGVVQAAKDDLTVAYLAAQAEVCDLNISGTDLGFYNSLNPLPPGVYCFSTSAGLTGTLALTGSATDTWTFQIGSTLIAETGSQVILAGGAIPDNVTWAVGSSATLRTNAQFQGNIMALASITLENGVTLLGRALAQVGAVDMTAGAATITIP